MGIKKTCKKNPFYVFHGVGVTVMWRNVQGNRKFLGDFLHNISANGSDDDVQYGSHLRWNGYNGIRVANSGDADYGRGYVDG